MSRSVIALACLLVGSIVVQTASNRPAHAQTTQRVSVSSSGGEGNKGSFFASISDDGRYIAFASAATNLVPGDANGRGDVFVHDRLTGGTTRVSLDSAGNEANDHSGFGVSSSNLSLALNASGRYVAFSSFATNLVSNDTNGVADVFVHDRVTGATERASVSSNNAQGDLASGYFQLSLSISGDGRFVAFASDATNLVSADTNDTTDIFERDRISGTTERVSVSSMGAQANNVSGDCGVSCGIAISADGRYVAFASQANNLVTGDSNTVADVFVHDRQTGATERVSVDSNGAQGNGDSAYPSLSADGRYVAFVSFATNLVGGDTNAAPDVFVHDRQTGSTQRVSVDSNGNQGSLASLHPALSADGHHVAFVSASSNFVIGDTNATTDIFVHNTLTGTTTIASVDRNGKEGNSGSNIASLSADGRFVAFESGARNLAGIDLNTATDVFAHTDCAAAVCGDGILDFGCEQCDDGNLSDADGCSMTCQSELIAGGGGVKPDCVQEWRTASAPARNSKGVPLNRLECVDDDLICDFGATSGDNACTFHIALCFNVPEQRFACIPTDVERVQLLNPREDKPKDIFDTANRDALEAALGGLTAVPRSICVNSGPHQQQLCTVSGECDSAPASGDGVCAGRLMAFQPPYNTIDNCTATVEIIVPRPATAKGKKTLRLKATPSNDPVTGKKRHTDADALTLVCKPHP